MQYNKPTVHQLSLVHIWKDFKINSGFCQEGGGCPGGLLTGQKPPRHFRKPHNDVDGLAPLLSVIKIKS